MNTNVIKILKANTTNSEIMFTSFYLLATILLVNMNKFIPQKTQTTWQDRKQNKTMKLSL